MLQIKNFPIALCLCKVLEKPGFVKKRESSPIIHFTIIKFYETNHQKTLNDTNSHSKLSTDINPTDSDVIASELTCVSVYRWRATGTDGVTSTQVRLAQCIVGWINIFISLFHYFSHSNRSHSLYSTFCLATAIPQMWSGLQRTITAQHQVSMTTTPYLICIVCLHYLLMPNMVTLLFYTPPSASPFFITSSLPPFSIQLVCSLCLMYMCTHVCLRRACECVKRGSACDIRPVCSLKDKRWNRFLNQEVGCCKGCCWGM